MRLVRAVDVDALDEAPVLQGPQDSVHLLCHEWGVALFVDPRAHVAGAQSLAGDREKGENLRLAPG